MRHPSFRRPRAAWTACVITLIVLGTEPARAQTPRALGASPTDTAITSRRASRIADSVLALMTLDEKLGQLTDAPAGYGQTGPMVDAGGERDVRAGRVGNFL